MIYEIRSKGDILSGAELIVKIPEEDLDRKALYTVKDDKPDFILPFRHRTVDGQIEFVYQIGTYSKLEYLAGDRYPKEYAQLWTSVLSPLLECGDWFLKPYSFVLDIKYLYCDKRKNTVSYLYIPSLRDSSDYYDLREMAADFSRQITVTDEEFENKVIRAIMLDFNPKAFLQLLKAGTAINASATGISAAQTRQASGDGAMPKQEKPTTKRENPVQEPNDRQRESTPSVSGEIVIDIPADSKIEKKSKRSKEEKKSKKFKEIPQERVEKKPKKRNNADNQTEKKPGDWSETITRADTAPLFSADAVPQSEHETYQPLAQTIMPPVRTEPADITQNISSETGGVWLRLIGNAQLPPAIDVAIMESEVFTIGRYDVAAGRRRSSFEFDKTTKAVSRRHAAIEHSADGYTLVDLSSSAGTFINGQRLPPNTPCELEPGCRVSFGNCGADYIWEP